MSEDRAATHFWSRITSKVPPWTLLCSPVSKQHRRVENNGVKLQWQPLDASVRCANSQEVLGLRKVSGRFDDIFPTMDNLSPSLFPMRIHLVRTYIHTMSISCVLVPPSLLGRRIHLRNPDIMHVSTTLFPSSPTAFPITLGKKYFPPSCGWNAGRSWEASLLGL